MANKQDKTYYPYARLKAIQEIMMFIRDPNWNPEKISKSIIELLNIAPSKESLVIKTLYFLGVIDSNGKPTDMFQALKDDYEGTLRSIVRDKYGGVFNLIPESLIDQERIVKFFMATSGTVRDTAEYQGILFCWLCQEAGISLPNLSPSFKRARFQKS